MFCPIIVVSRPQAGGLQATMEPGPFVHVNGRMYAGASPGIHNTTHDSSAQGSQFCLWPDPLNPRNCGPPSKVAVQYTSTLLMREILPVTAADVASGILVLDVGLISTMSCVLFSFMPPHPRRAYCSS